MKKFFKWLYEKIKIVIRLATTRTFLFLGFALTWIIPLMLLAQNITHAATLVALQKFLLMSIHDNNQFV